MKKQHLQRRKRNLINIFFMQNTKGFYNFFIKYYSNEGDTILDPTMGSGSTGVACKNMNRKFIGIEMDKDIYKVAEQRL